MTDVLCLSLFISSLTEFRESGHCSQDSMREDSFVSSTGPDQFSETAVFSGSDSETQGPATPSQDFADQPIDSALSDSEPPPLPPSSVEQDEHHANHAPSEARDSPSNGSGHSDADVLPTASEPVEPVEPVKPVEEVNTKRSEKSIPEPPVHPAPRRSSSVLSRNLSTDSTSVSRLTHKEFKDPDDHRVLSCPGSQSGM